MTCTHCGTTAPEGTTFCPSCGEMMLAAPTPAPPSAGQGGAATPPPEPQVVPVPQRPTRQRPSQPRGRTRQQVPQRTRVPQQPQGGGYPGGGRGGGYPGSGQWQQPGGRPAGYPAPRRRERQGLGCGAMLMRLILLALAIPVVLGLLGALLTRGMFSGDEQATPQGTTSSLTAPAPIPSETADSSGWGSPTSTSSPTVDASPSADPTSTTGPGTSTADPQGSTYPIVDITGRECARDGSGPHAATAAGNDRTSCEFAVAVQRAYLAAGADGSFVTLDAHSQARGANVRMVCLGNQPVQCTSGDGAVVYLYGGQAHFA